ncbi:MAG: hypothetical protein V4519_03220 [Patescibacteria group bacterium]
MHHLKKWSSYTTNKKRTLVLALIAKFAVFGLVIGGLMLILRNYVSPIVLVGIAHVIIFGAVISVVFVHTHKKGGLNHSK